MSEYSKEQAVACLKKIHDLISMRNDLADYSRHNDEALDEALCDADSAIRELPLSVYVSTGMHPVGVTSDPDQYEILLDTSGPAAVRIIGSLDAGLMPMDATIQHQDWYKSWTDLDINETEGQVLLEFAGHFYYGETTK